VGAATGLAYYKDEKLTFIEQAPGLPFASVTALALDAEGRLLVAHAEGDTYTADRVLHISRLSNGSCTRLLSFDANSQHTVIADSRIKTMLVDERGVLFFAVCGSWGMGGGRGIGKFDAREGLSFYTTADGLPSDSVDDIIFDRKGVLWAATLNGLARFDGPRFATFADEKYLQHNHVYCLCLDRKNRLWFGSERGVTLYDGRHFQHIVSEHINFTWKIFENSSGELFFGTNKGPIRYTPGQVPPRVRLVQVIADQVYQGVESLEIHAPLPQVIFEYKGMSFATNPRDMLYIYRLKGHDEDWCPATRQLRAFYQDLMPGEYIFEVKALDRDLNESQLARLDIVVLPDPLLDGLNAALSQTSAGGDFVGESQALRRVQTEAAKVATSDATVMILGETGTGKGLMARSLHEMSARRDGRFIQVNCGALPESLVESELFGHEKGAFTGAHARKLGKVELAAGGTLFLDEIGDMSLMAQIKLLRLLEERTFERVGGIDTLAADVRVVAATNRDLVQMVAASTFRQDLYYRLRVFPLELPSLRERREDIPLLATYFMERMNTHLGKSIRSIERAALAHLQMHDWPGNVRELQHAVERAVIVCRGTVVQISDIALDLEATGPNMGAEPLTLEEVERRHIGKTLEEVGWVIAGPNGAAVQLGLKESTLRFRMKKLGIERP